MLKNQIIYQEVGISSSPCEQEQETVNVIDQTISLIVCTVKIFLAGHSVQYNKNTKKCTKYSRPLRKMTFQFKDSEAG